MKESMNLFWWQEKPLRTVWRLEKDGRSSLLVGTAHFSPYSFEKALTRLIKRAETVLFEGPLDQESMARVVAYGRQGAGTASLYDALSPATIRELNKQLDVQLNEDNATPSHLDFIPRKIPDYMETFACGVRPWLAFFTTWSALLNWKHSMDVGAYHLAGRLGKKIGFLETIEDQLSALDGIPFERFIDFFADIDRWQYYRDQYLKAFLSGDYGTFNNVIGLFPTRCDSILARRDPVFFRGIKEHMEKGPTTAFVGNAHLQGLRELFLADGYRMTQEVA